MYFFICSASGEFKEAVHFYYVRGRDLISTIPDSTGNGWNYNFHLFGRTSLSTNAIQLNNYISNYGGKWKSYVFLASKSDPLPFTFPTGDSQNSIYIPGLQTCCSAGL